MYAGLSARTVRQAMGTTRFGSAEGGAYRATCGRRLAARAGERGWSVVGSCAGSSRCTPFPRFPRFPLASAAARSMASQHDNAPHAHAAGAGVHQGRMALHVRPVAPSTAWLCAGAAAGAHHVVVHRVTDAGDADFDALPLLGERRHVWRQHHRAGGLRGNPAYRELCACWEGGGGRRAGDRGDGARERL